MSEPRPDISDPLELAVEQAIAICDGDTRAALKAALFANVQRLTHAVSVGFMRGKVTPARKASEKVDEWREISDGKDAPKA